MKQNIQALGLGSDESVTRVVSIAWNTKQMQSPPFFAIVELNAHTLFHMDLDFCRSRFFVVFVFWLLF